ncbi:MAG: hypothetical protein FJ298_10940 [Planctomycetes bacterium]|nr:hypothetical protein [Planctomycetota bacterium]
MAVCSKCAAQLETPLACGACGSLFAPDPEPTPFECLGLTPDFDVDAAEVRRRLLRASRLVHPDFHGASGEQSRAAAERATAALNRAHALVLDPAARADWLVRSLGGPSESQVRSMPQDFLMEVMEWNEALDAARGSAPGSAARVGLEALEASLAERRASVLREVRRLLVPLPAREAPALALARAQLNALRYLANALDQLEALRLDSPSPR